MIKVDIVSGFLGAGKTTFIKKLLNKYSGENIVIIENEFGDIGIDGEILEREGYKMYEISTGCICCLMQHEFLDTLDTIIDDLNPERIIIEPTGISILSDIVTLLEKERFKKTCTINSLITIIDCENYLEQSEIFGEFFEDQITYATHLLLNKFTSISSETMERIILSVRLKNAEAPIVIKDWNDLTVDELYGYLNGTNVWDYSREIVPPERRSCREARFKTFAKEYSKPLTKDELINKLEQLKNDKFGDVLRGKGFVNCVEGAFEFSCTNKVFDIYPIDGELSGKICFVGVDLNNSALEQLWNN